MPSQRVKFPNDAGQQLAGIIELPEVDTLGYALFSHCFTCTKDLKAIVRVSRALAKQGIAVLRFDFRGLGDSQGAFAESNFETNLQDIHAATSWLKDNFEPPSLLIGMSLGGAAMMAAVNEIPTSRAIVTLAAPSNTYHLAGFLARSNPEIEASGQGEVVIGGRRHTITTQLLASLKQQQLRAAIESIRVPHLILHSPSDETLDYEHAENIFQWSGGEKSIIALPGSDHLLVNQPQDVAFVADVISSWTRRAMAK